MWYAESGDGVRGSGLIKICVLSIYSHGNAPSTIVTCALPSLMTDDSLFPPGVLFLIEGAGQSGFAMNWGDGIAADPALISQFGISDTNPFFKALMQKPYQGSTPQAGE